MNSATLGAGTLGAEATHVSKHGFYLLLGTEQAASSRRLACNEARPQRVAKRLGNASNVPIMASMSDLPHDSQRGFQFPGPFEIIAMGPAAAGLDALLPSLLEGLGLSVDRSTLRQRASAKGNYVSVAVSFEAATRADYDAAHAALRACPAVKWTI